MQVITNRIAITAIVLIFGVMVILMYMYYLSRDTYDTPEKVAKIYVAAVQQGDRLTLAQLTEPNHVIDQAVEEKIELYQMGQITDIQFIKIPTESPLSVEMRIHGNISTPNGAKTLFQDQVHLTKTRTHWFLSERWFIVLGTYIDNQGLLPKRPSQYN
jgi:hypothetical protein